MEDLVPPGVPDPPHNPNAPRSFKDANSRPPRCSPATATAMIVTFTWLIRAMRLIWSIPVHPINYEARINHDLWPGYRPAMRLGNTERTSIAP